MKITVLMENTTTLPEIHAEHGLSLYIETENHKILFDAGQSGDFADNAKHLGIDLSQVDIAFLSHGHYDHSDGLMRFIEINKFAPIYANRKVFEPYYNGEEEYIGIARDLVVTGRFIPIEDGLWIDEELELFSCNCLERKFETNPFGLNKVCDGKIVPDDFLHEQYLMIQEKGKKILISGCSHKGILNIMNWFRPDVLIGGFHFMKLDPEGDGREALKSAADALNQYQTEYYTGHCTGEEQFAFLKKEMGEKLHYITSGCEIII